MVDDVGQYDGPPGPSFCFRSKLFEVEMTLGRKLGGYLTKGFSSAIWHVQGWQNHFVSLHITEHRGCFREGHFARALIVSLHIQIKFVILEKKVPLVN